jgi:ATP-dependent protease HslVU (ClpYQ) peptidase subunit
MTCIAALVDGKKIYMGADSAGVAGYRLEIRAGRKLFVNNGFLFGFTSSFRMGQLLRYDFKPPSCKYKDLDRFMVRDFVKAVRKCLSKGGFAQKKDAVESGGTFLVGHKGRLYCIENDFQVGETVDGFNAVGCGGSYAQAALWALRKSRASPQTKILRALEAAEHFSAGVRRPFHVMEI